MASSSNTAVAERPLAAAIVGDTAQTLAPSRPSVETKNSKFKKPREIYRQEGLLQVEERVPRTVDRWVERQTNWTFIDWFAGMGGSSTGLVQAGFKLVHASNHWAKAIHTHHSNHPNAGHSQVDITRVDPSMFPTADVGWFSPECKNHSNAKGKKRDDGTVAEDVWGERLNPLEMIETEDGFEEVSEEAAKRSRAMMEDVVRIVDYNHNVRGKPFKYFIVENVPEVTDWVHFDQWWKRLENCGYQLQVVSLNSAFAHGSDLMDEPAAPQDRNRVYIVGTKKGMPEPKFEQRPPCFCTGCEEMVEGKVHWKNTEKTRGVHPRRRAGKYGVKNGQYFFVCPKTECGLPVEPYSRPISSVLDFTNRGETIGSRIDRGKPLKPATMDRIIAGIRQIMLPVLVSTTSRPGHPARALNLPGNTLTQRRMEALAYPPEDVASFTTPAGGTWRTDPRSVTQEGPTLTTRETDAVVMPSAAQLMPEAMMTLRGGGSLGRAYPVMDPSAAMTTSAGRNHGLISPPAGFVMRNNSIRGDGNLNQMNTPFEEPGRTLTTGCHQSVVSAPDHDAFISTYYGKGGIRSVNEAAATLTTVDSHQLVTSGLSAADQRAMAESNAAFMRASIQSASYVRQLMKSGQFDGVHLDEAFVNAVQVRMLTNPEAAATQGFTWDYTFQGNQREQAAGIGNAVSPPAARWIGDRIMECLEKTIVRGHHEQVLV